MKTKIIILDSTNNKVSVVEVEVEKGAELYEAVEEILPSNSCSWMEINNSTTFENVKIK